jgi:hypothetical protein
MGTDLVKSRPQHRDDTGSPYEVQPDTTLRFQVEGYTVESGQYDTEWRLETAETPVQLTFTDRLRVD